MGRRWQTLILSQWRAVLAYLPVEAVIREQQDAYYEALSAADRLAESTPFVAFMLQALSVALAEAVSSESVNDQVSVQVNDPVSDQVAKLLRAFYGNVPLRVAELMATLGLVHKAMFRANYLKPAMALGLIEMTDPGSPGSPVQRYRLTARGQATAGK